MSQSHSIAPRDATSASSDAASSARSIHQMVVGKRMAEMREKEKLARAQKRRRHQRYDNNEEDVSEDESDSGTDRETEELEEKISRRVRSRLTTVTHQQTTSVSREVNPLEILRQQQLPIKPTIQLSDDIVAPTDAWSADLTAAAAVADASLDDVDWEDGDDVPISHDMSHDTADATQPLDDDGDFGVNHEVLFGEEMMHDEAGVDIGALDDAENIDMEDSEPGAAVPTAHERPIDLNKVVVPSKSVSLDATAAAAASKAAQEGGIEISFERETNEEVAARIKAEKAKAKAEKANAKGKKDTTATSAGKKRKSTGESGEDSATKKPRRRKSDEAADDDDAEPKTKRPKKAISTVPVQKLTKAGRELMTHIQHVHLLSIFYLIQAQSSTCVGQCGIMNDPLIRAKLLSIALNQCAGLFHKQYIVDPRKASTWVGAKKKSSSAKGMKEGITWKTSHSLPVEFGSPPAPAASSSPPPAPTLRSKSSMPEPTEGTIFHRVKTLMYWFYGTFSTHPDRIAQGVADKSHPLYNYDTTAHVRMLHEVRCTCVRKRIIRAAVHGKGLTNPWRHYNSCLRKQFSHVLETKEGGFQHLTMLFVMLLREMGILTRLCYGIPQVNYRSHLTFPKADENERMQEQLLQGLGDMMSSSSGGMDDFTAPSSSSAAASSPGAESLVQQLLRQQHYEKQDREAIKVLDAAWREPCQCEKPFRPTIFGTPSKIAAMAREKRDADAAAAASSTSSGHHPASAAHHVAVSAPLSKSKSSPAAVHSPAPRKAGAFLSGTAANSTKSEAIDLLSSDEDGEIEHVMKSSPHFAKSSASKKPSASSGQPDDDVMMDDSPVSTTKKTRRAPAAKRTLDVSESNASVPWKRPPLKKAKSETNAIDTSDATITASSSTSSVTPRRAAKSKKITYVDPAGSDVEESASDSDDEESDEESNPCIICGLEESKDETSNPIMLCDGCDRAICLKCVEPPLNEVPDEYLCDDCIANGKSSLAKKSASATGVADKSISISKSKPKRGTKSTAATAKAATVDDDGDVEMVDAPVTTSSNSKKKTAAGTRKPRAKKGTATTAAMDLDAVDLTNSAPNTPPDSPKPTKSKKPRLTKAKSALTSTEAAAAASSSAKDVVGAPVDLLPALEDFDDSDADATASSSAMRSAGKSSAPVKQPKKMPFEHGYPLVWCEFYDPEEKRWVHVDVMRHLFDSEIVYEYDGGVTFQCVIAVRPSIEGQPHLLVDVTKRYTRKWSSVAAGRVDDSWLIHHMQRFSGECAPVDRDIENSDNADLEQRHTISDAMPTRVNEFKSHPLFCIEKFLLKFEMIYPSGPEHSKGVFIEKKKAKAKKSEDGEQVDDASKDIVHLVYPRSSLHTLHTVDRWRREQRAVKDEEVPYPVKVVKKLSQMSRAQREEKIRLGLIDPSGEKSELYGVWQTEPWMPEAAQNGIVPKNERGHVDVWGASHIPPGCVHLPHPRLKAACKKLGIDFADAMTGFDVKGGRSVPRFEGVVICQEFEDDVMKTYHQIEQQAMERAEKRRMKAITDNWKRLVRGSIIHSRVMNEVMHKAVNNELAFVPGAQVNEKHEGAGAGSSSSVAETSYGALATSLHAASAVAAPSPAIDASHQHAYSQRVFDLESNAWISKCTCGARQEEI